MVNNATNSIRRPVGLASHFKRILILLVALAASFQVHQAYAYSMIPIYYWYSDSDNIGHWSFIPTISKINYSSGTSFYFLAGYSHARTQWSQAGISTIDNGSNTSSNIVCKGGTANELANNSNVTESMLAGKNGVTYYACNMDMLLDYNGSQKYRYNMSSATIYIINKGLGIDAQKKTFTHEVGHALGWFGHSASSTDVMYGYGSQYLYLTTRDKSHLCQVY